MSCGPCKAQGKNVAAAVFCNECENELLCVECKMRHSVQPISRKHVLQALELDDTPTNASDEDRELFCDVCKAMNKTSIASVFCSDCENQLLCVMCEDYHRAQKITKMHKLQNLSCYGDMTGEVISKAATVGPEVIKDAKYKPGRPTAISVSFESIKLQWSIPEAFKDGDSFQLCYRKHNSTKWKTWKEVNTDSVQNIANLKAETQYIFRVRMIHNDWEGPYSDVSATVKTVQSAASIIIKQSSSPSLTDITPKQYELPMEPTERDPTTKIRSFELGSAQKGSCVEKTIMLVGETGTGKSTLVDGMANYILGVGWDDPFRFKMVSLESEEKEKSMNQALSQTEWITCYTIHPMNGGRLKYSINIIDTPGFGDTRGIEHDKKIVKQIDKLFSSTAAKGVLNVDAICFLVKAPDGRLTTSQHYIFNSIMSIFGKDIAENICSLITFADGNEPCVLSALVKSGLPFGQHFTFNNSALFAKNTYTEHCGMSRTFWEMGINSFRKFFRCLESLSTKSLLLTTHVLFERNRLELTVCNLEEMINAAVIKVQELKSEIDALEKYHDIIEKNKDYALTTKELCIKKEKLPSGENVTNCTKCNSTCHPKCKRDKTNNKKGCWAMDTNGKCRICPNKCMWNVHVNETYRYIYVEEEVEKTYEEMKQKYEQATGEALNQEQVLAKKQEEMLYLHAQMEEMMENVRSCNERLAEIALRPNHPLSEEEYIDKMIENERFELRTGFMERIGTLNEFKKKARIPSMIQQFCSTTVDPVLLRLNDVKEKHHVTIRFNEYIKRTGSTRALIVVAMDFGAILSGWAYSTHSEFQNDPTNINIVYWNSTDGLQSLKAPTCILMKPDGKTVEAFGYDAENRYAQLVEVQEDKDWYFFRRFKMKIYDAKETIGLSTMFTDETGKELDALTVYSSSIEYLKDMFYDHINSSLYGNLKTNEIRWVLTMPDIWNESAKQFMKISAQEAGIDIQNLSIAPEPEAASLYSLASIYRNPETANISSFQPFKRYLLCDIGGGTFDITVHVMTPDKKLRKIENFSSGEWSGTKVDEEFEKYIDTLAGCDVMHALKNKHMDDYFALMRNFELKKKSLKKKSFDKSTFGEQSVLLIPLSIKNLVEQMTGKTFEEQVKRSTYGTAATVKRDKIECDLAVLFDASIKNIIAKLNTILSRYDKNPIDHIIMTGGFSEYPLVQDAVRKAFPAMQIIIPINANLAVLGGAVMLGHNEFHRTSRIA